jgi:hypothetical protein
MNELMKLALARAKNLILFFAYCELAHVSNIIDRSKFDSIVHDPTTENAWKKAKQGQDFMEPLAFLSPDDDGKEELQERLRRLREYKNVLENGDNKWVVCQFLQKIMFGIHSKWGRHKEHAMPDGDKFPMNFMGSRVACWYRTCTEILCMVRLADLDKAGIRNLLDEKIEDYLIGDAQYPVGDDWEKR